MNARTGGRLSDIISLLKEYRRVVVALSGGVDSAVLAALAVEALGRQNVLTVTTFSAAVAASERREAERVAEHLGVEHREVETRELEDPNYRANAGDRCYHCRVEMFEKLREIALHEGYDAVVYGAIVDDLGDVRPGMQAARERGVRAPLLEAGLTKDDVRAVAARWALPVAAKPAAACLASRIPVGTPVTAERLARVEFAEAALARRGFRQFRVRHHGDVARLELDADGHRRMRDAALRRQVVEDVRSAGFRFVALDLEGYRSGSPNITEERFEETLDG
jgi:uncharacterized protein